MIPTGKTSLLLAESSCVSSGLLLLAPVVDAESVKQEPRPVKVIDSQVVDLGKAGTPFCFTDLDNQRGGGTLILTSRGPTPEIITQTKRKACTA